MKLLPHQVRIMEMTKDFENVGDFIDMGGGKTYIGSEQMDRYGCHINLVVCQKSKVRDWVEHFRTNYPRYSVWDLTQRGELDAWHLLDGGDAKQPCVLVINYDLVFRRPDLQKLHDFTLMLDESSCIQNERAKRTKAILTMRPDHVILLSGTPTAGKYEKLWSQIHLLGWPISRRTYYDQYVVQRLIEVSGMYIPVVVGYKNVDRLKRKLAQYGAVFMKSEEFGVDLPDMVEQKVYTPVPGSYHTFLRDQVITIKGEQLVGDTALTMRLYLRQICGQYNPARLQAVRDLLESTDDRVIIFYNFKAEFRQLKELAAKLKRPVSVVNGDEKDLDNYEDKSDSVTLIQYQAGAMGLNLQKANRVIYFTLPDKSELFEQSKARIHRIGQTRTCFYYYLLSRDTIEEDVLETLKKRKDYTDELFKAYEERRAPHHHNRRRHDDGTGNHLT